MVQSIKCTTPGFGSGHDLMVCEFEPHVGFHVDSVEFAWDFLSSSLSLCAPPEHVLKINKINFNFIK